MVDVQQKMCEIRIGTSGYEFSDWEDVLYYKGIGRSEYLGTYSQEFETVELVSTQQTMPTVEYVKGLLKETRRPIDFSVKAHRSLLASGPAAHWYEDVKKFIKGIAPIAEAGRLYAVLLEFPPSFHYQNEERKHLKKDIG